MNISLAARCAGRVRPSLLSGSRTACLKPHALRIGNQHQILSPRTQPFSVLSARRNTAPQNPPPGAQQSQPQSQPQLQPQPPPNRKQQYTTWILFNLAGISAAVMFAMVLKGAPSEKDAVMNTSSFSPFTITAKEQVSPTAFVVSVRAGDSSSSEETKRSRGSPSDPFKNAWDYGLWSVEAMQPQLQIARHYTPLPRLPEDDARTLRFLIRKLDGGEMSTYLSKLQVGEVVNLRGPHLSFDVEKRLGHAENVVFVAGGTGVAPALQVARKVLEMPVPEQEKPYVSILWANRRADDALGRERGPEGKGWMTSLRRGTEDSKEKLETKEQEASLTRQIREIREAHPEHFRISYFVDEEGSFIGAEDLQATLSPLSPSTPPPRQPTPLLPPASTCPWHSSTLLPKLPDAKDVTRHSLNCTCARAAPRSFTSEHPDAKAGANLIFVSGPDGFIGAYVGPKRWFGGGEMQGSVEGVLKGVLEERERRGGKGENWMVLKL